MMDETRKPEQGESQNREEEKVERQPLFDDEDDASLKEEPPALEEQEKEESPPKVEEEPLKGVGRESEGSDLDETLPGRGGRFKGLKWVFIGIGAFGIVLVLSLSLAALYVHRKEATLARGKTKKIVIKPVQKKEKKVVIKQYDLSPFFLRVRDPKSGEDRFLSVRLYIEFIREDLPKEIKTEQGILRTLIYKQLKKYFAGAKNTPDVEKAFKRELIPTLNTFFEGGGVYAVGFKELVIR